MYCPVRSDTKQQHCWRLYLTFTISLIHCQRPKNRPGSNSKNIINLHTLLDFNDCWECCFSRWTAPRFLLFQTLSKRKIKIMLLKVCVGNQWCKRAHSDMLLWHPSSPTTADFDGQDADCCVDRTHGRVGVGWAGGETHERKQLPSFHQDGHIWQSIILTWIRQAARILGRSGLQSWLHHKLN